MAWNTITYACGHAIEQQLYGKMAERERIISSAARHYCPACRAAAAHRDSQADGLPALKGSNKQVGWAGEIRARIIPEINAAIERGQNTIKKIEAGEFSDRATPEQCAAEVGRLLGVIAKAQAIKATEKATYWIDNRSNSVNAMLAA